MMQTSLIYSFCVKVKVTNYTSNTYVQKLWSIKHFCHTSWLFKLYNCRKKCLHYNDVKIKKPMDSLPQIFFFPFGIKYRQLQMATL